MRQIDFLSTPITLFYFGRRTHTSKVGGILMILMVMTNIAYISYLLIRNFSHTIVNSMFYKTFKHEAGYFSLNSSSLFHFFGFYNPEKSAFNEYDIKSIRIFTLFNLNFDSESDLISNDHWIYDLCEDGIDNKDIDNKLFINIKNFNYSACIKYFYNSTKHEYYSKESTKFTWPHLGHGLDQTQINYLYTIMIKCNNNSVSSKVLGLCNSEEKINKYINEHQAIYLYFKDNLVDTANYKNPIQSYFYTLTSGMGKGVTYVENYIHFNPMQVITSEGLLFNDKKYISSYSFDQNRKGEAINAGNTEIIMKYYYILQNSISIYERRYNNLLDIFSQIGGVFEVIFYCFYGINYLYNRFIIINDMNKIFFKIQKKQNTININNNELQKIIEYKKKLKILKKEEVEKSSKKLNTRNYSTRCKNKILNMAKVNKKVGSLKSNPIISKNVLSLFGAHKKSYCLNQSNSNANIINNINKGISDNELKMYKIVYEKKIHDSKKKIKNFSLEINDINSMNNMDLSFGLNNINNHNEKSTIVFRREFSLLYCIKNFFFETNMRNNLEVLINFRKKLLSEEHLFKNHITTVLFEKQNQIESKQDISLAEFYNEL